MLRKESISWFNFVFPLLPLFLSFYLKSIASAPSNVTPPHRLILVVVRFLLLLHRKSESSDEGTQADGVQSGQTCLHVNKSVNLNASKKALRQIGVSGDCTTCLNIARKTTTPRHARKGGSGKKEVDDVKGDDLLNGDGVNDDDDDNDDGAAESELANDADGAASPAQPNGSASPSTVRDGAIWLCLQCGHQGCGDTSIGHVLDHYKVRGRGGLQYVLSLCK